MGPDAHPFLGLRSSVSDEGWVGLGALSNAAYFDRLLTGTGIDLRSV